MKIDNKWLDQWGNIKANSSQDHLGSENPSTFNAITAIMRHKLEYSQPYFPISGLNRAKWATNDGKYMTKSFDAKKYEREWEAANFFERIAIKLNLKRTSDRFSHDETTGVVCSSFYFMNNTDDAAYFDYSNVHSKNLEMIQDCSKQTWYRFYDVGPMIRYAKKPWRMDQLSTIIGTTLRACKSTKKDRGGINFDAGGKIQAWLKLVGLGLNTQFEIGTLALPEKDGWVEVFRNYFPETDHPINVMARELYGDKL